MIEHIHVWYLQVRHFGCVAPITDRNLLSTRTGCPFLTSAHLSATFWVQRVKIMWENWSSRWCKLCPICRVCQLSLLRCDRNWESYMTRSLYVHHISKIRRKRPVKFFVIFLHVIPWSSSSICRSSETEQRPEGFQSPGDSLAISLKQGRYPFSLELLDCDSPITKSTRFSVKFQDLWPPMLEKKLKCDWL